MKINATTLEINLDVSQKISRNKILWDTVRPVLEV